MDDAFGTALNGHNVYPGLRREARLTPGFVRAVALRLRSVHGSYVPKGPSVVLTSRRDSV